MNFKQKIACVAGIVALSTPAAAFAPGIELGASRFTLGISGFVPVVCRASVSGTVISPVQGTASLGTLNEFCNSPNGYRVHADYSANLANAKIVMDGKGIPLQKDGTTVISQSNRASIESHALELQLPKGVQSGTISFRIVPL
jgi:hypothetical protein